MRWLRRRREIRSFDEDTSGLGPLARCSRGVQAIPIERIVGSVGRAHELRADFMPILRPHGDDRFRRICALLESGTILPPIEVYQLGNRYYVVDGNHRVAAAQRCGLLAIDAVVTEHFPVGGRVAGAMRPDRVQG